VLATHLGKEENEMKRVQYAQLGVLQLVFVLMAWIAADENHPFGRRGMYYYVDLALILICGAFALYLFWMALKNRPNAP
jgi:hypothetical protein